MSERERLRFIVRPGTDPDFEACLSLDHSSSSDYVWQVEMQEIQGYMTYGFRTVRLPRSITVPFPQDAGVLASVWPSRECFLVAEWEGRIFGYLTIQADRALGIGWVRELVVDRPVRRRRVGSALIQEALKWVHSAGLRRVTVEVQTKNHGGILFCQRHGFVLCGFNDRYFPNHDIALFFTQGVR